MTTLFLINKEEDRKYLVVTGNVTDGCFFQTAMLRKIAQQVFVLLCTGTLNDLCSII